jgi:glycosyltransferase involved in cell wall biosynthesis
MASVDVVVPCYQYGRYLRECVASVLNQGIREVRVLIIDNASTDDSVEIARQLAAEDPRVNVVARPANLGAHASFNDGIDWASADYFLVLSADDLLPAGALARAIAIMEENPDISFTFGTERYFQSGEPAPMPEKDEEARWRVLTTEQFIESRCRQLVASAMVVRTTSQKAAGHYRVELPFTDDLEMMLRLACLGNVAEAAGCQSLRRLHGANMYDVHDMDRAEDLRERHAAFATFFNAVARSMPAASRLHRLAQRFLAERGYWWGIRALASGNLAAGVRLLAFALRTRPEAVFFLPASFLARLRANGRLLGIRRGVVGTYLNAAAARSR